MISWGWRCAFLMLQHLITFFFLSFFLFSGSLVKSQFPVFTIYAQKSCLKMRPCERAWCIDRVQGYALKDHIKRSATAMSRQDCYEMCFGETDFLCRWVVVLFLIASAMKVWKTCTQTDTLNRISRFASIKFRSRFHGKRSRVI